MCSNIPTDATNIAEIARKLPPSTRELMLSPLYSYAEFNITSAWFHDTQNWAARQLPKHGLATRVLLDLDSMASVPTGLGLAVRECLQRSAM